MNTHMTCPIWEEVLKIDLFYWFGKDPIIYIENGNKLLLIPI